MNEFDAGKIFVVRPGQTELDGQLRICGQLDIPLSDTGRSQVADISHQFSGLKIDKIFVGPTSAAKETADILAAAIENQPKIKTDDELRNMDCGLWHGKRIDELKETQPKIFKLWQEHPQSVSPPDGETLEQLTNRVEKFAKKLAKKAKGKNYIVVAAEPVACTLRAILESVELEQYWTVEPNCGTWFEIVSKAETISS